LQPTLKEETYFELLDMPVSFAFDVKTLEGKFQHLQKTIHPDNFVSRDDAEEQKIALSRRCGSWFSFLVC
jgi:DnaJ-domain-containing protein 1